MEEKNTFDYQQPSAAAIPVITATREAYKVVYAHLLTLPESRGRSLAMTKLEESAMWMIKGIVFDAKNYV